MHEILIVVLVIILFGMMISYNSNSNNNNQCNFLPSMSSPSMPSPSMSSPSMSSPSILKRPPATTGCYEESWGINSVGYELETFPSIEEYSHKYYNNNLNNTDMQNIPFNFGNMIQDN